jgi:hypothetical protein
MELEASFPFRMKRLKKLFQLFRGHNYFPTIDRSGRLYTLLVMLPEPIRHFITHRGERLCSLDVKNSQPFLLSVLFSVRFWSDKAHRFSLKALQPVMYTALKKSGLLLQIRKHIRQVRNSRDVKHYTKLATTGSMYEYLVATYGEQHPSLATRGEAKQQFMIFLYFNPVYKELAQHSAYRQWAADFPNVATLLELVKQDNYTYLPRLLQALEAKLLLQVVVSAFTKHHPGVFITSIHDSLVTLDRKKQELEALIRHTYQQHIHHEPEIEVKTLCPENAYADLPKYVEKKLKAR